MLSRLFFFISPFARPYTPLARFTNIWGVGSANQVIIFCVKPFFICSNPARINLGGWLGDTLTRRNLGRWLGEYLQLLTRRGSHQEFWIDPSPSPHDDVSMCGIIYIYFPWYADISMTWHGGVDGLPAVNSRSVRVREG